MGSRGCITGMCAVLAQSSPSGAITESEKSRLFRVLGEKVARLTDRSLEREVPLVLVSASGGARMQEGVLSLMQMAKTSALMAQLRERGIPYISVLTNPTTGGVSASYAMQGDVNIAEPGAVIGFAGPRVIKQTINAELPEGFQMSEFLLEHGMVDRIVERRNLKQELHTVLTFLWKDAANHSREASDAQVALRTAD